MRIYKVTEGTNFFYIDKKDGVYINGILNFTIIIPYKKHTYTVSNNTYIL